MEFLEELNITGMICPPLDAISGKFLVYRLVDSIPIKIEDIWSYRTLYPLKPFNNECIARACSVCTDKKDVQVLLKLPKFKTKKIVLITIEAQDGVLLKTFQNSHHSWWISKVFNITSDTIKEAVECTLA
jgi:hypothetical protein